MDGYKLRVLIQTHISPDSDDVRYSRKSLESTNDGDLFIRHDQNDSSYIICENDIDYDGNVDNARKVAIKYIKRLAALPISRYGYRFAGVSVVPDTDKSYLVMYGSNEIMTTDSYDKWRGTLPNTIYNIGTILYRKYISRLTDNDIKEILADIKFTT